MGSTIFNTAFLSHRVYMISFHLQIVILSSLQFYLTMLIACYSELSHIFFSKLNIKKMLKFQRHAVCRKWLKPSKAFLFIITGCAITIQLNIIFLNNHTNITCNMCITCKDVSLYDKMFFELLFLLTFNFTIKSLFSTN